MQERNEKGHYNFTFCTFFTLTPSLGQFLLLFGTHQPAFKSIFRQSMYALSYHLLEFSSSIGLVGKHRCTHAHTHTPHSGCTVPFPLLLKSTTKAHAKRMEWKKTIGTESQELKLQWKCQEGYARIRGSSIDNKIKGDG